MDTNINIHWRYVVIVIIAVFFVYYPGVSGGFIYDDYHNILQNSAIYNSNIDFSDAWTASMSGTSGPLGRPLAMLSFYLNYQLSGFHPLSYKLINITFHAINSLLIFLIISRLLNLMLNDRHTSTLKREYKNLAFWVALIWAIHPINLTVVLYVVQRMTSMAAMFTLLGIYFYLNLREYKTENYIEIITRLTLICFIGVLAALCKENGLLLFLFLLVIEIFIFRWRVHTNEERWCLRSFYIFVLFIPLCIVTLLLINGDLTANYSGRPFDLAERVLTECRVIWFYIIQILIPQANLFGLHHDDFTISTSIFVPITTFISIIALAITFFISIKYYRRLPWFVFGLLFFFAGHIMESTILPLNLVHEHRNYLPSLGLIIVFVLTLRLLINIAKSIGRNSLFLIITILFSSITMSRAYDWGDLILLGERLVQRHPESPTANYEMGYAYFKVYETTHDPVFARYAKKALINATSLSDTNMQPAIALAHVNAMMRETEDHVLLNKIAEDFKYGNTSVMEVISFRQFINCHIEAKCETSDVTIRSLFDSLLNNEKLEGRVRDDALYIYSSYLITKPDGTTKALNIMQDIVTRNPNTLEYHVKLISMLLEIGNINEAELLMTSLSKRFGIVWDVVEK